MHNSMQDRHSHCSHKLTVPCSAQQHALGAVLTRCKILEQASMVLYARTHARFSFRHLLKCQNKVGSLSQLRRY